MQLRRHDLGDTEGRRNQTTRRLWPATVVQLHSAVASSECELILLFGVVLYRDGAAHKLVSRLVMKWNPNKCLPQVSASGNDGHVFERRLRAFVKDLEGTGSGPIDIQRHAERSHAAGHPVVHGQRGCEIPFLRAHALHNCLWSLPPMYICHYVRVLTIFHTGRADKF
jgi:hypothetical protein